MENYNGIAIDPRTEEEKSFDFDHAELAMGEVKVNWLPKQQSEYKQYKIRNQDGSLSCVAYSVAKMLGIHEVTEGREYVDLSPHLPYLHRYNYPSGGMWLPDALQIACKIGAPKETTMPCDMQGEAYMNDKSKITDVALKEAQEFKGKGWLEIKDKNIDEIAKVIEMGYPVLFGMTFDYDEWTTHPKINKKSKLGVRHGVAGVDYTLYNGKKAIVIEDSWTPGTGNGAQRVITESWIKSNHCFFVGYVIPLIKEVDKKVQYVYEWFDIMKFNGKNNDINDVKALQKCLQSIGMFPLNAKVDGIYGTITRKAVYDFQKKHVGTHNKGVQVGPLTLKALNKIFTVK